MELELADFPVIGLAFNEETKYQAGVLTVNLHELTALVMDDHRVEEVRFEIARPGERALITNIHDAVEPRIKESGPSCVFPGVLGPALPTGQGRTHRLSGCAVIVSAEIPWEGPVTLTSPSALMMAMNDPEERCPLSKAHNLVLVLKLASALPELEYHNAIQLAGYRVARRLAEATLSLDPITMRKFSLFDTAPDLPKVVIIQALANEPSAPHPRVGFYGVLVREFFPTWVHPNELLDGALTPGTFSMGSSIPTSWDWQNHAMAMALYQHHGKDLNFAGVILKPGGNSLAEKELMADRAAKLAHNAGASGAVICWMGSGQRAVDPMLTLQACERLGVKTVLVTWENSGAKGDEPPLVFTVPEADAMVSTGNSGTKIPAAAYDAIERVIGSEHVPTDASRFRSPLGDRDFFGASGRMNVEF